MAFLERFRLLARDTHGTVMFEADRFGAAEDYAATSRRLDGPSDSRVKTQPALQQIAP